MMHEVNIHGRVIKAAKKIVKEILTDISDRAGIGDEFDFIDDDIKREIKQKWIKIVQQEVQNVVDDTSV